MDSIESINTDITSYTIDELFSLLDIKVDENSTTENIKKLIELCDFSVYPLNFCGKRSNCKGCCFKSLFHETKQMGIVLKKSFKGEHFWIPPIPI
jgi:ribulose kinase